MAQDFENVFDLDDLSDEELRGLVRDQLAQDDALDIDNILVHREGRLRHALGSRRHGRREAVADHVLSDVIGLERYANDIFVDPMRRDEEPEAADEQVARALGARRRTASWRKRCRHHGSRGRARGRQR